MNAIAVVTAVFKSIPHIAIVTLNLLWMYVTLGRIVRKTRRAFELQLIQEGMSKQDAQRLSASYEDLKNNITYMVKQGITNMGFRTKLC